MECDNFTYGVGVRVVTLLLLHLPHTGVGKLTGNSYIVARRVLLDPLYFHRT